MRPALTDRNEQMHHQRHELHWTLHKIAEHWKISRQRVAQILGNTGRFKKASDTCTTTPPDNN